MSSIGDLVVKISADTALFRSDMGKIQKSVDGSTRQMADHFQRIGAAASKTFTMLAGVAGVGSLTALVKSSIDTADNMSKMSQKVGVAIEQLSGMAYAADLADVSTEQLAKGMGKLAKAMYEAAGNGNSDPAKTFKALGISATDSAGQIRKTDDVMMDIAERFAGMEDGAGKTALAIKIFGKAGADLIPLLNAGKAGIKESTDEARRFGKVLSEEAGKQAEEFNDNLTRLKTQVTGAGMAIANNLLPDLNLLIDRFAKGGDINNGSFMQGLNSIKAEFYRVGMLADKLGGTLTSVGMMLYGPGSALGVESSKARFEKMAKWNMMFEDRYNESAKALQTMANLEVGLDANGNPVKPTKSKPSKGKSEAPVILSGNKKPKAEKPETLDWLAEIEDLSKKSIELVQARQKDKDDLYQYITDETNAFAAATADMIQKQDAAAESAIRRQITLTESLIAFHDIDKTEGIGSQIQNYKLLHDEQTKYLSRIDQLKNPDGWIAQQVQIDATAAKIRELTLDMRDMTRTAAEGWDEGLERYSRDLPSTFQQMADAAQGSANSMQGSFATLFDDLLHGKVEGFATFFQSTMNSMLAQLSELMAKATMNDLMGNDSGGWMSLIGNVARAFGGGGGDYSSSMKGAFEILESAKGNVFSGPGISAYSNSIVTSPTFFATGGNVMGEAGPEAILPLTRTSGGKLGVQTAGSKGNTPQQSVTHVHNWNVNALDSQSFMSYLMENREAVAGAMGSLLGDNSPVRRMR